MDCACDAKASRDHSFDTTAQEIAGTSVFFQVRSKVESKRTTFNAQCLTSSSECRIERWTLSVGRWTFLPDR